MTHFWGDAQKLDKKKRTLKHSEPLEVYNFLMSEEDRSATSGGGNPGTSATDAVSRRLHRRIPPLSLAAKVGATTAAAVASVLPTASARMPGTQHLPPVPG